MLITEMQTNNATCQKEEKKQFDKKLFSVKKKVHSTVALV
jgi:hypothetical protein